MSATERQRRNNLLRCKACQRRVPLNEERRCADCQARRDARIVSPMEYFRSRYVVDVSDCWLWTARIDDNGYSRMTVGGVDISGHRFAYLNLVGSIPDELELDHTCRTRRCVNPAHLEPVTHQENMRRAMPTHCPQGHPYEGGNVIIHRGNGRTGGDSRRCRVCVRERQAAWARQKRSRLRQVSP